MRFTLPTGHECEFVGSEGSRTSRGLVVICDILGLRPLFDDLVARLAREHDRPVVGVDPWAAHLDTDLAWRFENAGVLEDDSILADVLAAADLTGAEQVDVIGFCMGGMYTFKAAGTGRFHRAAAFYGMIHVPDRWAGAGQHDPLDALRSPSVCPTLAILGGQDSMTPADDIEELRQVGVEVVVYDDAEHGFVHDPSRPAHRPADAADAWTRVFAFLDAN